MFHLIDCIFTRLIASSLVTQLAVPITQPSVHLYQISLNIFAKF